MEGGTKDEGVDAFPVSKRIKGSVELPLNESIMSVYRLNTLNRYRLIPCVSCNYQNPLGDQNSIDRCAKKLPFQIDYDLCKSRCAPHSQNHLYAGKSQLQQYRPCRAENTGLQKNGDDGSTYTPDRVSLLCQSNNALSLLSMV